MGPVIFNSVPQPLCRYASIDHIVPRPLQDTVECHHTDEPDTPNTVALPQPLPRLCLQTSSNIEGEKWKIKLPTHRLQRDSTFIRF